MAKQADTNTTSPAPTTAKENKSVAPGNFKPSFGVKVADLDSKMPILPDGQSWAAELGYVGINKKQPLKLQRDQKWNSDTRTFEFLDTITIRAMNGFSFGVELLSKKAKEILKRDKPMFFGNIGLYFHPYELGEDGNPTDVSYLWRGSVAFKEALNALGLGEENYDERANEEWNFETDLEYLYKFHKVTNEEKAILEQFATDVQILHGLNAISYYTIYFDLIAKDMDKKKCRVVIAQVTDKTNKEIKTNEIYAGKRNAPSSGLLSYVEGCEDDLDRRV